MAVQARVGRAVARRAGWQPEGGCARCDRVQFMRDGLLVRQLGRMGTDQITATLAEGTTDPEPADHQPGD